MLVLTSNDRKDRDSPKLNCPSDLGTRHRNTQLHEVIGGHPPPRRVRRPILLSAIGEVVARGRVGQRQRPLALSRVGYPDSLRLSGGPRDLGGWVGVGGTACGKGHGGESRECGGQCGVDGLYVGGVPCPGGWVWQMHAV